MCKGPPLPPFAASTCARPTSPSEPPSSRRTRGPSPHDSRISALLIRQGEPSSSPIAPTTTLKRESSHGRVPCKGRTVLAKVSPAAWRAQFRAHPGGTPNSPADVEGPPDSVKRSGHRDRLQSRDWRDGGPQDSGAGSGGLPNACAMSPAIGEIPILVTVSKARWMWAAAAVR
jgi:hypothetical protein